MKMAQTETSRIYQIEAITTPKNVTAHLNDLGLRVGVDILMVQKNCKSGIILHRDNRIALDASVMEQIDVSERQQQTVLTSLDQLHVGEQGKVVKIATTGALRRRLMDMGITKGTDVYVRKVAPFGDPVEVTVRGYELSLRKADAEMIEIQ